MIINKKYKVIISILLLLGAFAVLFTNPTKANAWDGWGTIICKNGYTFSKGRCIRKYSHPNSSTNVRKFNGILSANVADSNGFYQANVADSSGFYQANVADSNGFYQANVADSSGLFQANVADSNGLYQACVADSDGLYQANVPVSGTIASAQFCTNQCEPFQIHRSDCTCADPVGGIVQANVPVSGTTQTPTTSTDNNTGGQVNIDGIKLDITNPAEGLNYKRGDIITMSFINRGTGVVNVGSTEWTVNGVSAGSGNNATFTLSRGGFNKIQLNYNGAYQDSILINVDEVVTSSDTGGVSTSFFVILFVLLLLILAGVGFFLYRNYQKKQSV